MSLAFKIEEMEHEAEMLRSVTLATYEAIYHGNTAHEEFEGALNMVFNMSHDHMKHLKELTDEAYKLQRMVKNG